MSIFQGVAFFEDTIYGSGNTEVYYLDRASHLSAQTSLENVILARMNVSTPGYFCRAQRVSVVDNNRDSLVKNYRSTLPGTFAGTPLQYDQALLFNLFATAQYKGRKFLHSMPEGEFVGRVLTPSAPMVAALAAYATTLAVNVNGVVIRNRAHAVVTYNVPISASAGMMTRHKVGRPFGLLRGRVRIPA